MCLSPVSLTREIAGRKYTQVVPCGKCVECRQKEQNEFAVRCQQAARDYGNVWFITLTYNEAAITTKFDYDDGELDEETGEILPMVHYSLNRRDLTLWKKRVKKNYEKKYGKRLELHYLICGEYGPQTHRPHYHGMFFGLEKEAMQMLKDDWERHNGYTYFRFIPAIPINGVDQVERTSRYCAKYCVKIKELEDPLVIDGKVEKPRKMPSQNLGVPTAQRFLAMERYYLCRDMFGDYDPNTVANKLPKDQFNRLLTEIKKRRHDKPLPQYLRKKIFYKKDDVTKKVRATQLQKMVSKSLQMDIQKDYSRQLVELANNLNLPDDYEAYRVAKKHYDTMQSSYEQSRFETILSYNVDYLRRSKQ